jgi:hypothetical protein
MRTRSSRSLLPTSAQGPLRTPAYIYFHRPLPSSARRWVAAHPCPQLRQGWRRARVRADLFLCVCVSVRTHECACVCVCARASVCTRVCACACACGSVRVYQVCACVCVLFSVCACACVLELALPPNRPPQHPGLHVARRAVATSARRHVARVRAVVLCCAARGTLCCTRRTDFAAEVRAPTHTESARVSSRLPLALRVLPAAWTCAAAHVRPARGRASVLAAGGR